MEDRDQVKLKDVFETFSNEAKKTDKLIEAMRGRANDLANKGKHILNLEIKRTVTRQAIAELEELTERLVSLNIELELDCVDCPNFVIPYFSPGEETVHKLKFLSGDTPWNFWLVDSSVDTKSILKNLMQKYKNGLLIPLQTPKAAQSVCYLDRNKVIRGIVLQIQSENRIKLVDCDSNMTKVVSTDKLFKIDEDACRIHASALRCTITEEPDALELWKNADLRDLFCNTLRESTLGVKVIKRLAGSLPMFLVDVELQNEDEEATASLREWLLGRLLPELKKLGSCENDPVCDYLSEESLYPFFKGGAEKVINSEIVANENRNHKRVEEEVEMQDEELNNLNYSSDKLSKIFVKDNHTKEENNSIKETVNNFQKEVLLNSEEGSTSSSLCDESVTYNCKGILLSDSSHKNEPVENDTRLNYQSKEFHPTKKPNIQKPNQEFQNKKYSSQYPQPYPSHGSAFSHQVRPTHYGGVPLHQDSLDQENWTYHQQVPKTPWSPIQDSCPNNVPNFNRCNEVNVMSPEFIPKNSKDQQYSKKVELPTEPIVLRNPTTLIRENDNLLVLISHVEDPSEFYVHFVNKSNRLSEEMFEHYSTEEKIEFGSLREARSKLGKYCACKWSEDNHWYRVELLDWTVGDDLVKVWFVDHGNTECVSLSSLQPLTNQFVKLAICSQCCHLAKVYPTIKGQPWSQEAIDFFKTRLKATNHVYSVTVVQSKAKAAKQNSLSVMLFEGNSLTDSSKSINELLVEQGLAWSRSFMVEPASSISSDNYHSLEDVSGPILQTLPSSSVDIEDGQTLDEEFKLWDPCKEDFESDRNNPAIDTDDACVAVSGYSAQDEGRICKHYATQGFCFKLVCQKEHTRPNPDGTTTDKEEVYQRAFSQLELPKPGEVVRLKITFVSSINLFFAQIEEKRAVAVDDEFQDEVETLTSLEEYMNQAENIGQMRRLATLPAVGHLILARDFDEKSGTEWWYRARVIDHIEDDNLLEVMFVDYGSTCILSLRDTRKMEPRYLHLPFQAIECCLANTAHLKCDDENLKRGTALLQDVLSEQVLRARIYECEDLTDDVVRLQVLLELNNGMDVRDFLVENNIYQRQSLRSDIFQYPPTC